MQSALTSVVDPKLFIPDPDPGKNSMRIRIYHTGSYRNKFSKACLVTVSSKSIHSYFHMNHCKTLSSYQYFGSSVALSTDPDSVFKQIKLRIRICANNVFVSKIKATKWGLTAPALTVILYKYR